MEFTTVPVPARKARKTFDLSALDAFVTAVTEAAPGNALSTSDVPRKETDSDVTALARAATYVRKSLKAQGYPSGRATVIDGAVVAFIK